MPGTNFSVAVPAVVNCAVPRIAEFSHKRAVASQKVTAPGDTGPVAAVTVAVRVTAVPEGTVVTVSPATVTASVVAVGVVGPRAVPMPSLATNAVPPEE